MTDMLNINPGTPANLIKDATMETFMADVVEASIEVPILVDFWASWCQPCKQLAPVLEKVVREAGGLVRLVKVDTDQNQQLAAQLRIQSLPTVMVFKDGQPVDGFAGVVPESEIKALIKRVTEGAKSGPEEMLEIGRQALEQGDIGTAVQAFGTVAQAQPDNATALGLLARAYLKAGHLDEAEQVLATVPETKTNDTEVAGATAALKVARQAENATDLSPLIAAVEADGDNMEACYNLAMGRLANGDLNGAGDDLIEMIRRDRDWNEGAAKAQLLTMFEAEGMTAPFTLQYRRKLSAILFS